MTDVDVAVVGGGLMGSASARALARRGHSVALFEQFSLGHDLGSSHGSARIFRRAYADPMYVRMAGEAFDLWRELECDAGEPLLQLTGGLDFGRAREPEVIATALEHVGVTHELLRAEEAAERWPGIVFDTSVVFHPQAGTLDPENAVSAFLRLAGDEGAALFDQTPVLRIEVGSDGVELVTPGGRTSAGLVVVAAGAWVTDLLHGVLDLPPLEVTQQQIFHFPRRDPSVPWPVFVYQDDDAVYGLPGGRDGGPAGAQKVAEHSGGHPTTARTRDGRVDPVARERLIDVVRQRFPGLDPRPFAATTCLYTMTPDEDFVLDRSGPVIVASPCSGHGAKFAPLIGELVADLALDTGRRESRFRLDRFPQQYGRVDDL